MIAINSVLIRSWWHPPFNPACSSMSETQFTQWIAIICIVWLSYTVIAAEYLGSSWSIWYPSSQVHIKLSLVFLQSWLHPEDSSLHSSVFTMKSTSIATYIDRFDCGLQWGFSAFSIFLQIGEILWLYNQLTCLKHRKTDQVDLRVVNNRKKTKHYLEEMPMKYWT